MLKWLLIIVLIGYGGLLLLVYLGQRALQYFPERARTPPAAAGLPEAEEVVLDSSGGARVIVWHIPPRGEKPVVLYFHGNGGSL
ncbi:MAG: alpha/beta hydrolase, partial [Xanthobacteraceae bacterium]